MRYAIERSREGGEGEREYISRHIRRGTGGGKISIIIYLSVNVLMRFDNTQTANEKREREREERNKYKYENNIDARGGGGRSVVVYLSSYICR